MRHFRVLCSFAWAAVFPVLVSPTPAEARFAVQSDAASEIEFFNRSVDVNEDGTSVETIELKVKILNDSGRTNFATQPLYYDETTQKLKIIDAQSIDQGQVHSVSSEFIEDKPVASQANGFSSYRQVLVSFPHLHIGTEVYLKYILTQATPYLPGTFFTDFVYGKEGYWTSSKVKLTSSIPFKFAINDPESFLDVQSKTEGKRQSLEITLKKPVIRQVVDEQEVLLDNKALPWVSVSSVIEWQILIQKIAPEYQLVLDQPLPKVFQDISDQASHEPDTFKKINHVTSRLAHELHYMGDWRSISGRIYPNNFEKIAQSRKGDCKDFATVTTAILRKLGINAHVALVRRGGYFDDPNGLPSINAFDHAIVRVELKNQIYWVDPTNFVSFAHGLFPDISNRWALPLKAGAKDREKIPNIQPEKSEVDITEELKFLDKDRTLIKGSLTEKGSSAVGITGAGLRASKENIDFHLISFVGDVNRMSRWNFRPYDLTSRVVQDVKFEYEYEKRNSELKTSSGPGYLVQPSMIIPRLLTRVQDRVSDLLILDQPTTLKRMTLLKGAKLIGKSNLNCKLDSSWLSASRRVFQTKAGIEISDAFIVRQALVSNAELRAKEFLQLQDKLENCFNNVAITFRP